MNREAVIESNIKSESDVEPGGMSAVAINGEVALWR